MTQYSTDFSHIEVRMSGQYMAD